MILVWLIGAVGLYLAEGHTNPAFETLAESLWSVWVLLFSGLDDGGPKTPVGRFLAMVLLVAGVGLAGSIHGERGLALGRTLLAEK